jgi:hypothetical protein
VQNILSGVVVQQDVAERFYDHLSVLLVILGVRESGPQSQFGAGNSGQCVLAEFPELGMQQRLPPHEPNDPMRTFREAHEGIDSRMELPLFDKEWNSMGSTKSGAI